MIDVHESARKHGLDDATITALWEAWIEQCLLNDDHPERLLRLCLDEAGRAFELVGLVFDDERTLIIHAMRLRKSTVEILRGAR